MRKPPRTRWIGLKFGRLRVQALFVKVDRRSGLRVKLARCLCDCGEVTNVKLCNLGRNTRSCGCLRAERAGFVRMSKVRRLEINSRGGRTNVTRYGREYMARIGSKGGKTTAAKRAAKEQGT